LYASKTLDKTPMQKGLNLQVDMGVEEMDSSLYQSLVGSLIYMTNIRPNL
jgi:hypothetical protein